ncbi:accessory Sec system protein translocase subunit SecY2 [Staphylococcus aureus]|nr:accessory Sec system protein translocase subunit SecY2 [Staphylococcus singaporensis]MBO0928945.1 accessory Sec system protein translocase subunit SecY2 [Staphylococcus sp. 30403_3112M30944]MBO0944896.1 accessory Sec system protein translocase subunit SecY2 [Staphylococcus sp. 30402_3112M30943]MBO0964144.1 accessory Sec system protein translocase subunit SecY2 [Staphylococcus sp. 30400_3112M30941]MBO0965972.1 accessory Sec system protein translocase subunit SecY2 [Staphylococcus sp. 30401_31
MIKLLQQYEYKIVYKRMLYTCFILFIYILGTNISIVSYGDMQVKHESFFKIAISNMGGDVNTLNIFTLGLGPWLTSMIILMLISYRNMDKYMKQTRLEKHYKERILTLILSVIQSYFVIHEYVMKDRVHHENIYLMILILITGTMLLVWLADKNSRYGIAGPMPIVMVSIIKSMMHQRFEHIDAGHLIITLLLILVIITLIILLFIELVEVRLPYIDLMNVSATNMKSYLSWKVNPAGSITLMMSISVFVFLKSGIHFILSIFNDDISDDLQMLTFDSAIGISIYLIIQLMLGYFLSRFLINTKQKAKDFLKSGNYFLTVKPGKDTERYLNRNARRMCWFGSALVTVIIGIPLYCTLLVPHLSTEIYFAVQLIVLIYISINIAETIRTYLYFDKYKSFLNQYW